MKIDQGRYKLFWRNPEMYRLVYEIGIVPETADWSLQRGTAFHVIADMQARGATDEQIDAVLRGEQPDSSGRYLKLTEQAIDSGRALWNRCQKSDLAQAHVVASEAEFEFDCFDSPHKGVGRLDRVIEYDGELWVLEFKTTHPRRTQEQLINSWKGDVQADFEILGAESLGFEVRGVIVQYVVEDTPPRLMMPIPVIRSPQELDTTRVNIHNTCEIIELLRRLNPLNIPWPHLDTSWPCSARDRCPFRDLCQKVSNWDSMPPGFERRVEHLRILREGVDNAEMHKDA
jgi:hypothetical protein